MLPIFASLLLTGALAGSNPAVSANPQHHDVYYVSVPIEAGSPDSVRKTLLEAAARQTLNDGHRSFYIYGTATGTTTEARIALVEPIVVQTAGRRVFALKIRELPDEMLHRGIDAKQVLDTLAQR